VSVLGRYLQVSMMSVFAVRDAEASDLEAMRAIYNDVLVGSTAIFSDVLRTAEEQVRWYTDRRAQSWPVLVACVDGELVGFASYGPFRSWPGYRHTVENSIYLKPSARGRGFGKRLLAALLERARSQGLHAVIAGIDGGNEISMRLHEKLGFKKVGHLQQVGRKFERWLDLVFFERVFDATDRPDLASH
jgi:L-amino acid N-acyltransferase